MLKLKKTRCMLDRHVRNLRQAYLDHPHRIIALMPKHNEQEMEEYNKYNNFVKQKQSYLDYVQKYPQTLRKIG